MKQILLGVMIFIANMVHSYAVYPEDVFAFELSPSVREYLVAPSGNKIQIYRSLDITDQGFFFNIEINISAKNEFQYFLTVEVSPDGALYLQSFRDNLYMRDFSEKKLLMPSITDIKKDFSTQLGDDFSVKYQYHDQDRVELKLLFGQQEYILVFKKNQGLVSVSSENAEFSRVTRRVYEQTVRR